MKIWRRGSAREFKKYNTRKTSRNTIARSAPKFSGGAPQTFFAMMSHDPETPGVSVFFRSSFPLPAGFVRRFAAFFFRQRTRSRGNTHAPRMPEASRAGARRHKRARSNTHRLARGGRVSVPRARVSSVATDARTARGRCATIARGVGHQKRVRVFVCVSNAEASRRDDGRGVTRAVAGR